MIDLSQVRFDSSGLIPAIVQDANTLQVLMLGYMNSESLTFTKETKKVHFWSRSRSELWLKGATSGNFLTVQTLSFDCDQDAILVMATPTGPTCHTGSNSCFEAHND